MGKTDAGRTSVFEDDEVIRASRDIRLRSTDDKTLIIAIYPNFFPIAYRAKKTSKSDSGTTTTTTTTTMKYAGLDVDILLKFCAHTGLVPKFKAVKRWFDLWNQVDNDQVDVAIGGISRDSYRDKTGIEWTAGYYRVMRTIVYRLDDPITDFPKGVTGKVRGTMGSSGMNDAYERIFDAGLDPEDIIDDPWPPKTDEQDVRDLLNGKIQGLMRGSFVGRAIVEKYPKQLGMMKPWNTRTRNSKAAKKPRNIHNKLKNTEEVFAFPCRRGSGLANALTAFIAYLSHTGELRKLKKKYGIETRK